MSFPGVPPLKKLPSVGKSSVVVALLGMAQGLLWKWLQSKKEWGVYVAGTTNEAFAVDSVIELTATREASVSDYRIETGSFATYNKVSRPMEIPIRLSKGGSTDERGDFLVWLKQSAMPPSQQNPTLFDILTPEGKFFGVTLSRYSVRRTATAGVTVIYADCVFVEVRQIKFAYYKAGEKRADTTAAAAPAAKPPSPLAKVQSMIPGMATLQKIKSAVSWLF